MLTRLGFATAALDARLLAAHALGFSDLEMATRETETVPEAGATILAELVRRRMTGESVGRIIGEREFYGLAFGLNAATLEPRADTELLVDLALDALPPGGQLLDLGTGTGCIPIGVLANRGDANATATDISPDALEMAARNAARHGVSARLQLLQGDWFAALGTEPGHQFDLIVSNPPYIETAVIETLSPEVRAFDPLLALDGGPDGLAPYRIIATGARHRLKPGGNMLVEIGHDQGAAVTALLAAAGWSDLRLYQDLAGLDRVVGAHHI